MGALIACLFCYLIGFFLGMFIMEHQFAARIARGEPVALLMVERAKLKLRYRSELKDLEKTQ